MVEWTFLISTSGHSGGRRGGAEVHTICLVPRTPPSQPERLLIVMPTWLGDCVMATPTLRALRQLWPGTHVAVLVRDSVAPILDALPAIDQMIEHHKGKAGGPFKLARRLAAMRFDMAVLLPNSFRTAALAAMSGIPRRVGYERDGRGVLLTDRLVPRKDMGRYLPVPTLDYYLGLARYLGAVDPDPAMTLATRHEDEARAGQLLHDLGHGDDATRPLVLLNPGAQKPTKRWPAERFAALGDKLRSDLGADIAVTGAPAERDVLDAVIAGSNGSVLDLPGKGMDLRLLKAVTRRCDLMVTNDTGPRHIAAAFGVPVITLFGPTGPEWTQIYFEKERMVIAPGEVDPAGESDRRRPRRHMGLIEVDDVFKAAGELLGA